MSIDESNLAPPPQRYDVPDFFLQNLVDFVNEVPGRAVGITVQTHGFLVSGSLISGKIYFEELAFLLESVNGREKSDSNELIKGIREVGDIYTPGYVDPGILGDSTYIHIKGAKFLQSKLATLRGTGSGFLWRGRLAEVSGFFLGDIEMS